MSARLRFFGAAREVTGSMHLLEVNGHTVALDCGLFQGRRAESEAKNRTFPVPPDQIAALILSHAHIDHCGRIPRLVRDGFSGPIYATPPTCQLAPIMMADSGKIQEEDAAYMNKKRARRGEPPVEPLYVQEDAERAAKLFVPQRLGHPFEAVPGLRVTFHEAGHMLGSAGELLEISDDGRTIRLTFTGDLGRAHMPILKDPAALSVCDYLISESTYGGRVSDPPEDMRTKLAVLLNETFARGGKVLVPAFAVGRTQSLVYEIHQLARDGQIPGNVPIFVDSPLAMRATQVYRENPQVFDREAVAFRESAGRVFDGEMIRYVENVEESKALHGRRGPLVVIAASGMCEAGRILHHLKNNVEDSKNLVLIVGFQAANTLGRRIVERYRKLKIYGEFYRLNAQVKVLNGYSSHANANELLAALSPLAEGCQRAFLVHGEPDQAEALAANLNRAGFDHVSIPEPGAVFDLATGRLVQAGKISS